MIQRSKSKPEHRSLRSRSLSAALQTQAYTPWKGSNSNVLSAAANRAAVRTCGPSLQRLIFNLTDRRPDMHVNRRPWWLVHLLRQEKARRMGQQQIAKSGTSAYGWRSSTIPGQWESKHSRVMNGFTGSIQLRCLVGQSQSISMVCFPEAPPCPEAAREMTRASQTQLLSWHAMEQYKDLLQMHFL